MLYTQTLTVPPSTQLIDAAVETIQLTYGRIQYIWLHFPPGCRGAVSVALFHSLTQVAPATPGEGITLDNILFGFPTDLPVDEPPYPAASCRLGAGRLIRPHDHCLCGA